VANCPLVIDLDGTLIYTDMLHETALRLVNDHPLNFLKIIPWLVKGKAHLKNKLAYGFNFDPNILPYNEELLSWIRSQREEGRKLVLCTASDSSIAHSIARHLDIFDDVIASDGISNIAGRRKADALEQLFGKAGFDYAGNSKADLHVWKKARRAIVVNASRSLEHGAGAVCDIEKVFPRRQQPISTWLRVFRVHQWLKNILLFIPLFAAHELLNIDAWHALTLAFVSFSLCASSVYIANDLLDLESDRLHPRKRKRPFASGRVPIWMGTILAPALLGISFSIAETVSGQFLSWLALYFAVTCAYSLGLKRIILIDCITLAILYTLRIVAGSVTVGHTLSFWLLAFSVFLFISLGFVKRYAELEIQSLRGNTKAHGRGYKVTDASLVQTMGIASGYTSVLVLALYLNSDAVVKLYRSPEVIWAAVPVMLFWISWMWMQAHRGKMHDDPIVFAVRDRASLLAGVVFMLVLALGTVARPW
jgi:4-hydroxybenzoate polyprenyltransferase